MKTQSQHWDHYYLNETMSFTMTFEYQFHQQQHQHWRTLRCSTQSRDWSTFSEDKTLASKYANINKSNGADTIKTDADFPTVHTELQRYFNRASFNKNGGFSHCSIRAGHTVLPNALTELANPQLRALHHGIYKKSLQVPYTQTLSGYSGPLGVSIGTP